MAGNTIIELVEEIKQEGTFDYIEITGDSINPPGTYIDVYHGKYKVSLRRLNNPSPLMQEGNEINGYVDFVEILKKTSGDYRTILREYYSLKPNIPHDMVAKKGKMQRDKNKRRNRVIEKLLGPIPLKNKKEIPKVNRLFEKIFTAFEND